ncbi:MAG: triphosphoribosyl-dephospho-CoA synthase [Methanobrevibacter sp.]|jgi:triphosphoribosyl-dephospho-CoA synthase|nr:triphosphoribosyl-dephospho-CoA synthase [Candidatus Methanovirga australis]
MLSPNKIAQIAQISSVLEVSGYPKPGNVHRTRDFQDMVFEDFLISGIVIGDTVREATSKIFEINHKIKSDEAFLGKYILKAVKETDEWIANNTNLGIIMLLIPIACSGAISNNLTELQNNVGVLIENTNSLDAVSLYKAIGIAKAGGMGSQDEFDVTSIQTQKELISKNQTMYDVLKISASWDSLANELTSKMPITFNIGFKTFFNLKKTYSLNISTVLTFLTILSNVPDTLISRKYGKKKAKEVSNLSKELLKFDDYASIDFKNKLIEFDDFLFENRLNPGTTADLTAASIMINYLNDFYENIL